MIPEGESVMVDEAWEQGNRSRKLGDHMSIYKQEAERVS